MGLSPNSNCLYSPFTKSQLPILSPFHHLICSSEKYNIYVLHKMNVLMTFIDNYKISRKKNNNNFSRAMLKGVFVCKTFFAVHLFTVLFG